MAEPTGNLPVSSAPPARQRSPRPESTMALNFSETLDAAFNTGGELPVLEQSVQEKKQTVTTQNKELEELEARIKAAEERLKKASTTYGPAVPGQQESSTTAGGPFKESKNASATGSIPMKPTAPPPGAPPSRVAPMRPNPAIASSIADRVPTPMDPSRNGAMPGAMPETPGGMKDSADYYGQGPS